MSTHSPNQIETADRVQRPHSPLRGRKWATGCLSVLIICWCQISCLDPKERSHVEVYGIEFRTRYSHGSAIVEGDFIDVERRGYWGWSRVFRAWHADSVAISEAGHNEIAFEIFVRWQWVDPKTRPEGYPESIPVSLGLMDEVGSPYYFRVDSLTCPMNRLSRLSEMIDAFPSIVTDSTGELSGTKGLIGYRKRMPDPPL